MSNFIKWGEDNVYWMVPLCSVFNLWTIPTLIVCSWTNWQRAREYREYCRRWDEEKKA
jgi:hypothetical protein